MKQSVVTIRLNGHPYQIGCGEGEENHVAKLGDEVEEVMQSLIASVGQIGEARLLAMVALILADKAVSVSTRETKSAGPFRLTCKFSTSPKSRSILRLATVAALCMTLMRAERVAIKSP